MAQYDQIYSICDFVDRTIQKQGQGKYRSLFVHPTINFVKSLSDTQKKNPWITIAAQAGGCIWVYYRNQSFFQVKPPQNHLRLIISVKSSTQTEKLTEWIDGRNNFKEEIAASFAGLRQWRCHDGELKALSKFLVRLPKNSGQDVLNSPSHPRMFSGPDRQAALEAFIRGGRVCPGFNRKPHKVGNDRIEFDHILPYAKGGATSLLNIQVLCAECNRQKRDRA